MIDISPETLAMMRADTQEARDKGNWHVNVPPGSVLALIDALEEARAALKGLVDRLDEIHTDPAYQTVWTVNQIHAGPYRGPTYVDALSAARAALEGKATP